MTEAAKEREGEKERWRRTMLFSKATQKIEKARNEPTTSAAGALAMNDAHHATLDRYHLVRKLELLLLNTPAEESWAWAAEVDRALAKLAPTVARELAPMAPVYKQMIFATLKVTTVEPGTLILRQDDVPRADEGSFLPSCK